MNVEFMTRPLVRPDELAELVGGKWTSYPDRPIHHIRVSLELTEPDLQDFLLVPELFYRGKSIGRDNALLTCREARKRGACGFLVTEVPRNLAGNIPCLIVEDTSEAIGRLADYRRERSNASFVAVTGSAGKTTTKEIIAALLSSAGRTAKSIFNYNSDVKSTNFTLANVSEADRFCSVEFSGVGDIEVQGEIYRPDVAVITNVLWVHAARFEKRGLRGEQVIDAIVDRKTSLIRNLSPGGFAILNRDNQYFAKQRAKLDERPDVNLITFGKHESADVRLVGYVPEADGSLVTASVRGTEYTYELAIPGEHMANNSLAGLAVASALQIDIRAALDEIATLRPGFRRGQVVQVPWQGGTITAINESVGSNIPAASALFKTLAKRTVPAGGRRIVVLGNIGELGSTLSEAMDQLAEEAATYPIDRFYTVGAEIRRFNQSFPDRSRIAPHTGSLERLYRMLEADLAPGDIVAFKGARVQVGGSLRRLWDLVVEPRISPQKNLPADLPSDAVFRVVLGGDTYLGEYYQEQRARNGQINYLKTHGYSYSGEKLKPLFERADFAILNLECALTDMKTSPLDGKKGYILGGSPKPTISALKDLAVDVVLLGNNHAMDYGEEGLRQTLDVLGRAGITAIGAGHDRMSSQEPFACEYFHAGSTFKLAVISAYKFNRTYESEYRFFSGDSRWGVNNINVPRLRDQIADLKAKGYYVVVSPHWGENYCLRNFEQQRIGRNLIQDCRADLVIGHGPHMYNEIGKVGDNWVLYSIGNLIFNSEGEYVRRQLPPYSFVAELVAKFEHEGYRLSLNAYPIISCNQMTCFQPDFLDDAEFERFTAMLRGQFYDPFFFDESIRILQEDGRNFFQIDLI